MNQLGDARLMGANPTDARAARRHAEVEFEVQKEKILAG
jgi:hypothetical protein